MKRTMIMAAICASSVLALAAPAWAQDAGNDKSQSSSATDYGVYGTVGGGLNGFTESTVAADTNLGGYWDARLGVGMRSIFGAEVGYLGGSRNVTALGLNNSAFLYNNGLQGLVRLNAPITAAQNNFLIEPYAFGGLGWQHYALGNATTNTSDVRNNDDVMTVPMGVGIGMGYSNFTLDLRGTYHQALFSNMFGNTNSGFDSASLNSWGAGLSLGFMF